MFFGRVKCLRKVEEMKVFLEKVYSRPTDFRWLYVKNGEKRKKGSPFRNPARRIFKN